MSTTSDYFQLRRELNALASQPDPSQSAIEAKMAEIKACEEAMRRNELQAKLDRYNKEQARRRYIMGRVLNIDIPAADILKQDGYIHLGRVKRYPELEGLLEEFGHVKFSAYGESIDRVSIEGKEYRILPAIRTESGEYEHRRFKDLSEALKWHGIAEKPVSLKQAERQIAAIRKASSGFEKVQAAYWERINAHGRSELLKMGAITEFETYSRKYH